MDVYRPCGHRSISYRMCEKHWKEATDLASMWKCTDDACKDLPRFNMSEAIKDYEFIRSTT